MDEVVAFLARALPAQGIETTIWHTPFDARQRVGRLGDELTRDGVKIVDRPGRGDMSWLQECRYDVASVHGAPDWVVEALDDECRIPVVEIVHGMHSLFGADPRAVQMRGSHLAAVVAVSDLVRNQYAALNPLYPADRLLTLPNGVDRVRRAPYDREESRRLMGLDDEFIFVCLARHCLQKNTFGLVAAFSDVAAELASAHLMIAGRPDDMRYTRRALGMRERLPSANRIHLRDHAPDPSLLLSAADAFVLDSFFEGWALASMEALCAGLPVVLADVGGAREQLSGGLPKGCLVANPLGDPLNVNWDSIRSARFRRQVNRDDLVNAMLQVSAQRDEWRSRRGAIAEEAARRFSPELWARRHAAVLEAVAQGGPISGQLQAVVEEDGHH